MEDKFPHLFAPGKMGNVRLPNRIVFLPHVPAFADRVTDTHINYYAERARGGTGLIIVGAHAVSPASRVGLRNVEAFSEKTVSEYKKLSGEIQRHGAKAFVQLSHCGHTTTIHPPQLLLAPSQMSEPCYHYNTKELEIEDMERVRHEFVVSAKHVKEGGFDGVEVKGASHDGMLRSFISPYFNRRTDEYGGSFENRMRFPLEMVHAIREAVGPDFVFGVRVCMDEFTSWGYGTEEGRRIVQAFAESGEVDYISCDAGCYSAFYMEIPPMSIPLGFAEYLSAEIKGVTDLPVIAFGRINDPVQAERILAEGNADFIGMARELICDPEFGNKAKEGREDDIRHCIACQDGCIYQVMQAEPILCIQNPAVGREAELGMGTLQAAEKVKRVVVIGGGPAGMKVAEVLARRGHEVVLYEEKEELGGQVNIAAKIPHREEVKEVVRYLGIQLERLGIEVHVGRRVSVEEAEGMECEVVVVATGSRPAEGEEVDGHESENVLSVWDVLLGGREVGEHVVLYDITRRWAGLGTAEYLAEMGRRVDIVVPTFHVGEQLEPGNVVLTYQRILEKGVNIIPNTSVKRIEESRVVLENVYTHREEILENVDTVVLSVGNRSDRELYDGLKGKTDRELYFVGDAVAPRQIQQVIFEAEKLARSL